MVGLPAVVAIAAAEVPAPAVQLVVLGVAVRVLAVPYVWVDVDEVGAAA